MEKAVSRKKTIAVIGWWRVSFEEVFKKEHTFYGAEVAVNPYYMIKQIMEENGYRLVGMEQFKSGEVQADTIVDLSSSWKVALKFPQQKYVDVVLEPVVVMPVHSTKNILRIAKIADYVLSIYDEPVDNQVIFKSEAPFNFDVHYSNFKAFEEKKLLAIVIGGGKTSLHPQELYSKRLKVIRFFEQKYSEDFDFYGRGWKGSYRTYKGETNCKMETYSHYKFAICFENSRDSMGYVTEKIFDCLVSQCVPVYWGAKNITDYVPANCFLDYKQFASIEDCYQYLKNMDKQTYQSYLDNIAIYLASDQKYPFTPEAVAKTLMMVADLPKRAKPKKKDIFVLTVVEFVENKSAGLVRKLRKLFHI